MKSEIEIKVGDRYKVISPYENGVIEITKVVPDGYFFKVIIGKVMDDYFDKGSFFVTCLTLIK